jgi:hypothetical protein
MNFTAPIFTKPVIAERRHIEFYCTDFHTDGKEIQNLQTEILYAMKPSVAVSGQILTKIVLNIQLFKRSPIPNFKKIQRPFSRARYVTDGHGLPIRFFFFNIVMNA